MLDKKILFVVENGFVSRSLLRSDFLNCLKENFKQVVVLVPLQKLVYYRERYQRDNVIFDEIKETKDGWLKQKFYTLLKFSIPSREARFKLMKNIFKEDGFQFNIWFFYFPPVFISHVLSHFKFWRGFLRKIYSTFSLDPKCLDILQKHRPDVVFANYTGVFVKNFNLKLLKAAKKKGILTIGNIVSWDQLYSKVFITHHTDFLNVHNEIIKKEAVRMGDFKREKIVITGIPHFDFYFKKELAMPREQFFESIGGDAQKKLVFYAADLAAQKVNDAHFVAFFDAFTRERGDVQVYFRPHPKALFDGKLISQYQDNRHLIFEQATGKMLGRFFELAEKDNQLLFNLIFHCNVVVCFTSTILIEGCLLDRPVVSVYYNGRVPLQYYYRLQTHRNKEHLEQVLSRGCSRVCLNDGQLREALNDYLENPALDSQPRKLVAQEQAFLLNGKAAYTLAQEITEITKNNT